MTMTSEVTSEAKRAFSTTIRHLRQWSLDDLKEATELTYRLSIRPRNAGLDEAASTAPSLRAPASSAARTSCGKRDRKPMGAGSCCSG